jgi:hypothetical protein
LPVVGRVRECTKLGEEGLILGAGAGGTKHLVSSGIGSTFEVQPHLPKRMPLIGIAMS